MVGLEVFIGGVECCELELRMSLKEDGERCLYSNELPEGNFPQETGSGRR